MTDEFYMRRALALAERCLAIKEVPVGCVVTRGGEIIGRGYNRRNERRSALGHAEMDAIAEANRAVGDWRLEDCALYVTIEPCAMCAGAVLQSRMGRLVFGARNPKAGCVGSVCNLLTDERFNWRVDVTEGVLAEESGGLVRSFFAMCREEKRAGRGPMPPAFTSFAANLDAGTRALFAEVDALVREAAAAPMDERLVGKRPTYAVGERFVRLTAGGGKVAVEAAAVGTVEVTALDEAARDALRKGIRETLLGTGQNG